MKNYRNCNFVCWKKKVRWNIFPLEEKARLGKELFNAFRKLDLLQELIEDVRLQRL